MKSTIKLFFITTKYLMLLIIASSVIITSCSENVSTECDCDPVTPIPGTKTLINFSEIQKQVFTPSCATTGCHAGSSVQANLDLSDGSSYNALINITSLLNPNFKRVKPGDSQNSFLIKMLRNSGDGSSQMPPTGKLNDSVIDSIAAWIDKGALND
ncbi:MAG: hypothetical protein V1720_17425 [bacterium]